MKVYVFQNEEGDTIAEVRAANHDIALAVTGLPFNTDFYSYEAASMFDEMNADLIG